MHKRSVKNTLERLAARAGPALRTEQPHWGDAVQCDGLLYAARALGSKKPLEDAIAWFEPKLTAGPQTEGWIWSWSAEALPALDIYLLTGQTAYLDYAAAVVDALEAKTMRTSDGAIVPHPPAVEVWVDISYFAAPALARLGLIRSDTARMEAAADQLLVHQRYLQDEVTGLFRHVAYLERQAVSPCLWARGNAWFGVAATEVLLCLGTLPHCASGKAGLGRIAGALARQLNAVAALQDAEGLWHTVLDRTDSYLESSAAAGFALALGRALAMKLSGLEREQAQAVWQRAIQAVTAKVDVNGEFTGVSQQTPPGDLDFYNSIEVGSAPYGTGLCMMTLAEALQGAALFSCLTRC